jgi:hypothetical protein
MSGRFGNGVLGLIGIYLVFCINLFVSSVLGSMIYVYFTNETPVRGGGFGLNIFALFMAIVFTRMCLKYIKN